MTAHAARSRFRRILSGDACVTPASVFDPMSARLAELAGCEALMLAGSVASMTVLAAPDLTLLTLTELADLARRICRATDRPLLVDADHGYGNALSVMRAVEELESAGVAALTIEDTALPERYAAERPELILPEEAAGKLRAAVAARGDPDLAIVARTSAVGLVSVDEALARMRLYAQTGVDALFFAGVTERRQVEAIRRAIDLPILLGGGGRELGDLSWLAGQGVRVKLQGHESYAAALRAAFAVYERTGKASEPSLAAATDLLDRAMRTKIYADWRRSFLEAPES